MARQADRSSPEVADEQARDNHRAAEEHCLGAHPAPRAERRARRDGEEQRGDHQVAQHVADPPGPQRSGSSGRRDDPGEPQAGDADQRADRRADDRRGRDEQEDVGDSLELGLEPEMPEKPRCRDRLQGVPRPHRKRYGNGSAGGEVDEEGSEEDARPEAEPEEAQSGKRDTRRRPDQRREACDRAEQEAQPRRDEVRTEQDGTAERRLHPASGGLHAPIFLPGTRMSTLWHQGHAPARSKAQRPAGKAVPKTSSREYRHCSVPGGNSRHMFGRYR